MPEKYSPPSVWEDPQATGAPVDLLVVVGGLVRRWPFILAMGAGGFCLALAVAFSLTPTFVSKAMFLPPTQRVASTDNPLAALLKAPSTAIYSGLLLSDTVLSDVVRHCDLQHVLKARDEEGARTALSRITRVSTDSSGFVTVQVTHKDPKLAQAIASNFLSALGRLNDRMAVGEASQQRHIFEDALKHEKDELEAAEIDLKRVQESSGVIMPQSQMQAGLLAIDSVRAQIRGQQVRLTALLQALTEQSPEVVRVRSQIGALESQLHRLETGSQGAAGEALTASKAPSVNLEFVRLEREVKYHQVLFDIMAKQYENARMEESSAAPGVQVVDYPQVPLHKSWPPRALFALAGAFLGMLAALAVIFVKNRLHVLNTESDRKSSVQSLREAFSRPTLHP